MYQAVMNSQYIERKCGNFWNCFKTSFTSGNYIYHPF